MLPQGFAAVGVRSGIAKKKDKKDLALFLSAAPATAAGMFTANIVKAAPVTVSMKTLASGRPVRLIVANSGGANACTGTRGRVDAQAMCAAARAALNVTDAEAVVASTGVIGQYLPMAKVRQGIREAAELLGEGLSDEASAAAAIMTTDTFPKVAERTLRLGAKTVRVWGCAKGSGMIHPDLRGLHATMFAFILTDAAVNRHILVQVLRAAVQASFNCVTVDGDTSTNDTVVALANGRAGNRKITGRGADQAVLHKAVSAVCLDLAKMIARDGEGATKLVEIAVCGAKDATAAREIAKTIATSPLVKTALFGCDANWGRVIAAAGRAGISFDPGRVTIAIDGITVARKGMAVHFSEAKAKKALEKKEVKIRFDLGAGTGAATYYTCDFSCDYVKINGSYRS